MKEQILYPEMSKKAACTRREQVLLGMWAGKGTKQIAADLGLSPKTVEYHRAELYRVFAVFDPVSLCRRAMVAGLIKPDVCCVEEEMPQKRTKGTKRGTAN